MAKLNTKIVMLKCEQGKDGTNIKSVEKSASDGLTDTYTITLTDGSKSSFNVTNGKGITSISKTGSIGLDDIYTITYNDETTSTFTVQNGENVAYSIQNQIVPTASIEREETASKAYSKGDFLVKDGILYKVTKTIAEGDTLTVGANIASDTLGGEISSLSENTTYKDISSDVTIVKKNNQYADITQIKAMRRGENVRLLVKVKSSKDLHYNEGFDIFRGTIEIKGLKIRMTSTATVSSYACCVCGAIDEDGVISLRAIAGTYNNNTEIGIPFDLIVE